MKTANFFPSNGTDGMIFTSEYCDKCAKEKRCPILRDSMIGVEPKEWFYVDNTPICKVFKPIGTKNKKRNRVNDNQLNIEI